MDVYPVNGSETKNIVDKVEQASSISSELSSSHQKEFYKEKKNQELEKNNKPRYSEKNLMEIIDYTNRHFSEKDVKMKLELHKLEHRLVIKLIDIETKDIIKTISSEEVFNEIVSNWGIIGNLIDTEG